MLDYRWLVGAAKADGGFALENAVSHTI